MQASSILWCCHLSVSGLRGCCRRGRETGGLWVEMIMGQDLTRHTVTTSHIPLARTQSHGPTKGKGLQGKEETWILVSPTIRLQSSPQPRPFTVFCPFFFNSMDSNSMQCYCLVNVSVSPKSWLLWKPKSKILFGRLLYSPRYHQCCTVQYVWKDERASPG